MGTLAQLFSIGGLVLGLIEKKGHACLTLSSLNFSYPEQVGSLM